jgi:hypothetical protein
MRYQFIPLGLVVVLLAGCGQDPAGPSITPGPQVDAGRAPKTIPVKDDGLCLKRRIQLSSRVDQGGFEALPHPRCPKIQ